MSLINAKNFVAPLQNKLHIGAIIVVAFLVAVIRLSSKPAQDTPAGDSGREAPAATEQDTDAQIANFFKSKGSDPRAGLNPKAAAAAGTQRPREDDLLNQIMQDKGHSKKTAASKEPAPAGGLNDIRKSLGLE
jgi:hypothetical protein